MNTSPSHTKSAPLRALSLDALRGLAIIGMVFSGLLPFGMDPGLPAWMFHAQTPPPTHAFNPAIPGITWVDLVFPLFLFALGAAVPLALSNRLESGKVTHLTVIRQAFVRSLLLLFFGVFIANVNRSILSGIYGHYAGHALTLLAFTGLFLVFVRFPAKWQAVKTVSLRVLGWAIVAGLLLFPRPEGTAAVSIANKDIIIVLLASVSFYTTLLWLCTKRFPWIRIAVILIGLTLHLCQDSDIWVNRLLSLRFLADWFGEEFFKNVIWAINPAYLKYLAVSIPGTIAGDLLLEWIRPSSPSVSFDIQNSRWRQLSLTRCIVISVLCLTTVGAVITGLYLRQLTTTAVIAGSCGVIGLLTLFASPGRRTPAISMKTLGGHMRITSHLFRALFIWGLVWLAAGLALEPYQGGIRKDPATLSYYFVTAGLSTFLLIVLIALQEILPKMNPLIPVYRCGQNPMMAYVAAGMLVIPLVSLIPVGDGQNLYGLLAGLYTTPWQKAGFAALTTFVMMIVISLFSRNRIFWRA